MSAKHKRRDWDEVLFENEYFLILIYVIFLFFSALVYLVKELKEKIFPAQG